MTRSQSLLAVCALVFGGAFSIATTQAAPPCPDCYYPYRACMRSATTPAEQQACSDEYQECYAMFCSIP
ncbi:hypothetical protein K4L06_21500 [Lysobacter sp. BMK333-48F3]|uniref:hypothetical protein n=1 Tax=Lysobacter sp. BMK333-48F3 TaxID=2867962 RepID=UPI001C8BA3A1|nr:hypothetical protein [Lysobacter sp. BMK333-48F3]MBX9403884.1 hypothetical protein [Lysobacter sp. BMK333-48F3]